MAENNFLSRWSRKKAGLTEETASTPSVAPVAKVTTPTPVPENEDRELTKSSSDQDQIKPPPPTLDDVEKIDVKSPDFSAFMRPDVDPLVQQAALKKMFSDPHFNVMDGLDIYIDDYSKPDPLPPGMLQRLAQSDMLNLFRNKPEVVAAEESAVKPTDSLANPEHQALEAKSKTDLTSTGIQGANESTKETTNLSNPSSELEQKKT
mgnify:CR=1 FL=1